MVARSRMQRSTIKEVKKVVDYLWHDEQKHYAETGYPKGHIFRSLKKIRQDVGE